MVVRMHTVMANPGHLMKFLPRIVGNLMQKVGHLIIEKNDNLEDYAIHFSENLLENNSATPRVKICC